MIAERIDRAVLQVVGVSIDGMPMDTCDDDRVHVWVTCLLWSGRRAFLTQGTPFLKAAGLISGLTQAETLAGECFYGDLELPPFEPESGERIQIENLELCPPLEETISRLQARMDEGGSR